MLSELGCVSKEEFITKQDIFVIGLAGKSLLPRLGREKEEKLPMVYVMSVTDILTYDEYYVDGRCQKKIPREFDVHDANNNSNIAYCGDNIYSEGKLAVESSFHHENGITNKKNLKTDLFGECVLLSSQGNYIYYGQHADGETDIGEVYRYAGHKRFYFNNNSDENKKLKNFISGFDAIEKKGIIAPPINSKIRMEDII